MTLLLSAFPDEYNKDIECRVMNGVSKLEMLWKLYFNVEKSDSLTIKTAGFSGFAQAPEWKDGKNLPMDEPVDMFDMTLTMLFYGMGFKVSRKHLKYGLLRIIQRWADSLPRSVEQTYGITHANVLNNSFSTTYTQFASQTLCSNSHTTAGSGTRDNLGATAAMTPATIEALMVLGSSWVNYRGLNDPIRFKKLITCPSMRRTAVKLLQSEGEMSTTDNDINTHKGMFGLVIEPLLSSTTAYWLQSDRHFLYSYHGLTPSPLRYLEDSSQSLVHGIEFDFVVGPEQPDGIVGSPGA